MRFDFKDFVPVFAACHAEINTEPPLRHFRMHVLSAGAFAALMAVPGMGPGAEEAASGATAALSSPDARATTAAADTSTTESNTASNPHPADGLEELLRTSLPPGGEYVDGRIVHTVMKGQSLGLLCSKYLYFTDYYTTSALAKAITEANGLSRAYLSPGQKITLPGLRTIPLTAHTVPQNRNFEAHGIYVTMTSAGSERVLELVRQMKPAGLNSVVIDIKDMDGVVAYKTKIPLALKVNASERGTIRDLPKLVNLLHAEGIHIIARQVVFHDRMVALADPRLAIRSKSGGPWRQHGKQVWVDPANSEIQDYNVELAREVVGLGIDEVQFDYIRFPAEGDVTDIEYSFDTRATPKYEVISGFLKRATEALRPMGALVSVDVYGVSAWDKKRDIDITGQKIDALAQFADVISPMLYPSHFYPPFEGHKYPAWEPYYFVNQGVLKTAQKIGDAGARIRPWLQAFPYKVREKYGPDYVTTQLLASHEVGALGYLLWNAQNDYGVGLKGIVLWNAQRKQLASE